jgi:uncharacterized protein (TIGR02246 family)
MTLPKCRKPAARIAPVLTSVLLAFACACTSKPDIEAARSVSGDIEKALSSKDIERFKANFTDDAVLLLPNQAAMAGADAIASRYAAAFKQINYNLSLTSSAIESAGDVAVDRGSFGGNIKSGDGGATAQVSGKYLNVLKWQAGRWRILRAAWEFEQPADPVSCSATGSRSCCCKDIGGNDCVKSPEKGCDSDYPISILLP